MRLEQIPLNRISLRDERFRISRFFSTGDMPRSIREFGLLSPPLVRPSGQRFVLVSGWKRVLACREIGLRRIPALITDEGDDLKAFLAVVQENLTHRTLSLSEKAEVLAKLMAFGQEKKALVREQMPALSLPATASHLKSLLALSRARADVKQFAHEKDPPVGVLESLLRFGDADRTKILPLIRPLGQNKQREVLDDLWEIGRRDRRPVRRLLERGTIGETLRSEKLPPGQKADRVRRLLREARYPALSSRQAAFEAALRGLGWPREIAIQPSPYFDDEYVSVSFRFRNGDELRRSAKKLEQLADRPGLAGLFRE